MTGFFRSRQPFLQTNAWKTQVLNALRYNTSQVGSVVPWIFGTVRQPINLLGFLNFTGPSTSGKGKTTALPIGGTSVGGKGGGSKGKKTAPDYKVDVAFAVGEGVISISSSSQVWASGEITTFGAIPLNFYSGTNGQGGDPTLTADGQVVNYSGTGVITATPMDLGSSPVLPNFSVETGGAEVGTCGTSFPFDANAANVITTFLTDPQRGAGFPLANLDDLITPTGFSFAEYIQSAGLATSVSIDGQQTGLEWIAGYVKLLNSALVWSGKLLRVIPYGDLALSANGATWTPNLTPVYSFTDDHFLPWRPRREGEPELGQEDPILATRVNEADAVNWASIEYTERGNNYNTTTMAEFDQSATDVYSLRTGDNLQGKAFCSQTAAQVSLRLHLQRLQYVRNSPYKFKVGWQFARLEPMDIVLLTGRYGDNYLQEQPVRVLSIEEDDNGDLTVTAEEIQVGTSATPPPSVCVPPGIDGHVAGSVGNRTSPGIYPPVNTLILPALSTSQGQDRIFVFACASSLVGSPAVLGTPTGGGLTFVPLAAAVSWDGKPGPSSGSSGTIHFTARVWSAPAASVVSGAAITITTSPDATGIAALAFGVSGTDTYTAPFDATTVSAHYSSSAPVPTSLTVTGLTTTHGCGSMLAFLADVNGWTAIGLNMGGWVAVGGGGPTGVGGAYAPLGDFYPSVGAWLCPVSSVQSPAPVGFLGSFNPYGWISFGTSVKAP